MPTPASPASLVYLCRLCSVRFPAYPVNDAPGMLAAILRAYNQLAPDPADPAHPAHPSPIKLPLTVAHACDDGRTGVADVAGVATTG
jgi:hypothetical protein